MGLKMPDTLCNEACHFLVIKTAGSFPMNEEFVPELNCTIFFIQCWAGKSIKFAFMPNAPDSKVFEDWSGTAPTTKTEAPEVEQQMERE